MPCTFQETPQEKREREKWDRKMTDLMDVLNDSTRDQRRDRELDRATRLLCQLVKKLRKAGPEGKKFFGRELETWAREHDLRDRERKRKKK